VQGILSCILTITVTPMSTLNCALTVYLSVHAQDKSSKAPVDRPSTKKRRSWSL